MYRTTRRENGAGVTPPYCRWRRRRRADPLWPTAVSAKRRRQRRDGAHLYAELTTDTDDDKTCMCWTLTLFTRVFKPNNSTSVLVVSWVVVSWCSSKRSRHRESEQNARKQITEASFTQQTTYLAVIGVLMQAATMTCYNFTDLGHMQNEHQGP